MITDPYLLVLNVPLHRHAGEIWADPLWKKDLEAHLVEIPDLAIACPVLPGPPPAGWARLERGAIRVHALPPMRRWSMLAAPLIAVRLWRAIGRARIVHTGVAGWPFPIGWIAVPIARSRRRFVVIVVESAFWRIAPTFVASPLARARAALFEAINKACIRRSDVSFYTSEGYRDTLHAGARGVAHVAPAVWVDAALLVDEADHAALEPVKAARLLFAGRLTEAKGVLVLIEAIRRSRVAVDIIGEGDLRDAVVAAQAEMPGLVRLLDPVEYGDPFFALLDRYAALVVPTLTDEQPRIIYDAFARGLPALASDTPGNRIVEHGVTGLLAPAGDADALAALLRAAAREPTRLHMMGLAALKTMASRTHAAMHSDRAASIMRVFSASKIAGRSRS